MDFSYDEEQQALREAVRGLLARSYSDFESRRRTVAEEPGFDEKLWTRLAEMGVLGLPFPEQYGGMGAGPVEVAVVAQEVGRVLAPEPFLTAVVLAGDSSRPPARTSSGPTSSGRWPPASRCSPSPTTSPARAGRPPRAG